MEKGEWYLGRWLKRQITSWKRWIQFLFLVPDFSRWQAATMKVGVIGFLAHMWGICIECLTPGFYLGQSKLLWIGNESAHGEVGCVCVCVVSDFGFFCPSSEKKIRKFSNPEKKMQK